MEKLKIEFDSHISEIIAPDFVLGTEENVLIIKCLDQIEGEVFEVIILPHDSYKCVRLSKYTEPERGTRNVTEK